MIFVAGAAFCQKPAISTNNLSNLIFSIHPSSFTIHHSTLNIQNSPFTIQYSPLLNSDFYSTHLGFFCKKEIQFVKTTHIPLIFRLGSLQQCNLLEGKLY